MRIVHLLNQVCTHCHGDGKSSIITEEGEILDCPWCDGIGRVAKKPKTVTLCGSTARALQAFEDENLSLTLLGYKVFSIGCSKHGDQALGLTSERCAQLDDLHLYKIDDSDIVYFLNVGGYLGASSRRELAYAVQEGKEIWFLESALVSDYLGEKYELEK